MISHQKKIIATDAMEKPCYSTWEDFCFEDIPYHPLLAPFVMIPTNVQRIQLYVCGD